MNEKLYNFLKGRNGSDELTKFALYISLFFAIIGYISNNLILNILALIGILYANFRVFSRNLDSRIKENLSYKKIVNKIKKEIIKKKNRIFGKDGYKYFACKSCSNELRIPKGKGKLKVKCPHCENIMIK